MSVSDQHVCRSFGYIQIRWKVKHFWLWSCIQNWEVGSPAFDVRTTRWRLLLRLVSIDESHRHLRADLHRLSSDNGPDVVRVHWKVSMCNCTRRISCCCHLLREMEQMFRRGDHRPGALIEDMKCLSNHLKPFESDNLVIECKLVVDDPEMSSKKWSSEADDKGLRSLSDDLNDLFRKGYFSDMVIRIGGVNVPAVKAIVYARNKTLAEIIDRDISAKVIELPADDRCPDDSDGKLSPEVNADAVWQLVGYLHHGRLDDMVFVHPSVSAAECARILDVQEVRAHYIPDELTLTSGLNVEEHAVTWFVTEVKEGNVRPIVSPTLIHNSSEEGGTAWRLVLYPRGKDGKGNHVAIYAEASGGGDQARSKLACLEFVLVDREQNSRCYRRLQKPPGVTFEGLGVDDFLERPFTWEGGSLRVVFKLRISDGAAWVFKAHHHHASVAAFAGRLQHLQRLSNDVESLLYEAAMCPEFKVRCCGGSYPVHRSIMAARARSFSELAGASDELDLEHMGVSEAAMSMLLLYIYSGQLQSVDKDLATELLTLADYLGVDALYRACSRIVEGDRVELLPSSQEE